MPLSKENIIEIQAAAEYLTRKRIRENQEQLEYKEELADKIAEARSRKTDKPAKKVVESKKGE